MITHDVGTVLERLTIKICRWDLSKGDRDHLIQVTACQYYSNQEEC